MKERKGFFQRYFIDALGAMAQGLFASLIIGTIFGQLAKIPHMGFLTNFTMHIGDAKSPVIGCAIGVAIPTIKSTGLAANCAAICWATPISACAFW